MWCRQPMQPATHVKPSSPLLARALSSVKPTAPLRGRNTRFRRYLGEQRRRGFHASALRTPHWCRWFHLAGGELFWREKVRPAYEKWPKNGVIGLAGRVFSRKRMWTGRAGRFFSRKRLWMGLAGRFFSRKRQKRPRLLAHPGLPALTCTATRSAYESARGRGPGRSRRKMSSDD